MKNKEALIKQIILDMDKPFKMSDLFNELSKHNIFDKTMILNVLDSLINCGLVEYADVQDDVDVFCSALA